MPPTGGLNCNLHTYFAWELNCSLLVHGTTLQPNKPQGHGSPCSIDSWAASPHGKEELGSTSLLSLPSPCAAQTRFSLRVQETVPVGFSGPLIPKGIINEQGQCKSLVLTAVVGFGTLISFLCVPSSLCHLHSPLPSATSSACLLQWLTW